MFKYLEKWGILSDRNEPCNSWLEQQFIHFFILRLVDFNLQSRTRSLIGRNEIFSTAVHPIGKIYPKELFNWKKINTVTLVASFHYNI